MSIKQWSNNNEISWKIKCIKTVYTRDKLKTIREGLESKIWGWIRTQREKQYIPLPFTLKNIKNIKK